MIRIKETGRPRIEIPRFSQEQMHEIGQFSVDGELQRLGHGINAQDQPSRPLKPSYAKQKEKAGAQPVRDLRLTGAMLTARQVTEVSDNTVTVGFTDPLQEAKAAHNEQIEPMLGVSPENKRQLDEYVHETFRANVRKINGR